MSLLGNILLVLATLLFFGMLSLLFGKDPRGGDGLMGYAWGIIFINLAFAVPMILVSLIIGYKGGFEWVTQTSSSRFWLVTIGLLGALITTGLSGLFKFENGPVPFLLRTTSSFVPVLIPLVLIGAGFILVNSSLKASVPLPVYKWPLVVISIFGLVGVASAIVGEIALSQRNRAAMIKDNIAFNDSNHARMLSEIDSCVVMKNLVFILVFTDENQDPEIRDKALAKVKTHPEWQQELMRLLQTEWAPEPFQFLASNDVDDPTLFLDPINAGLLVQARLFRERIRSCSHPSHLYSSMFNWDVERILRTVEKYDGKGVDYLPAMKEVRAALDEPSEFAKPEFDCTYALDNWIKAHS